MKHKTTAIRLLGGLLMAVALLPWVSGTAAQAATTDDPRAVAYDGNAQPGDCTVGGLSGSDITSKVTATNDGTLIDITAVAAGYSVTGIVVKAGDGYNVYKPGQRGLSATPPWLDLRGPDNGSAGPAGVSHWYVCGVTVPPPSSPPVTTSAPATTPAAAATTAKASPSTSVQGAKNAKPPAVLPKTGSGMSLGTGLAISLGLLLGGAALMFGSGRLAVAKGKRRH